MVDENDRVVARHDIAGSFRGSRVPAGTEGVVIGRWSGEFAVYRVKFVVAGPQVIVISDLTEYDIVKIQPVGAMRQTVISTGPAV